MNQPDPDLLESLEDEYLALVAAGDAQALQYALTEAESGSDRFGQEVLTTLEGLMRLVGPRVHAADFPYRAAGWARDARQCLLQALAEHVAPAWANEENHRRQAKYRRVVGERS